MRCRLRGAVESSLPHIALNVGEADWQHRNGVEPPFVDYGSFGEYDTSI